MNETELKADILAALQELANRLNSQSEEDAIAVLRGVALLSDDSLNIHKKLADYFYKAADWQRAVHYFEQCCTTDPKDFASFFYIGNCLKNMGSYEAAVNAFERSIAIKAYPEGYINLASAYSDINKKDLELHTLELLVQSFPEYTLGHYNLGVFWYAQKNIPAAIQSYENALRTNPDDGLTKVAYSLALLMDKQYVEGFRMHDSRWGVAPNCPDRELSRPRWHGQSVSEGSSILVTLEQGFGDTLQMLRYIPFLATIFNKIVIEVQPQMQRLVALSFPDVDVIVHGTDLPETDLYCPIMSLPGSFGTTYDTIPNQVGYIRIPDCESLDPDLISDPRKKIGVCWRGGMLDPKMAHRSLSLKAIKPLLEVDEYLWVSLVKDIPDDERTELRSSRVIDLTSKLTDFYDTYRLILDLDVVITVDTAVAHLAGAMGKPTVVILNEGYDWRWHVDDETSAWYPRTRLFRAYKLGDSADLVPHLLEEIKTLKG